VLILLAWAFHLPKLMLKFYSSLQNHSEKEEPEW
jgi:hypothetical protein